PVLRNLESNPQFLQLAMPNETVLVITLSARIGPVSGLINVCLPHATLEPLLPKLSTQHFMDASRSRRSSGGTEDQLLQQHVFGMQAEVSVVLGSTELTMQEVLDLQTGDVIPLAAPIRAPLTVCVNGVPTFLASVGRRKQRFAVRVVGTWKEVSGSE
ncbi:MAG: FliM/FliN family flagellar motor switch protein, partial [Alicyclobacillus sp.]|nr:FliM/FliN family flagellar motor switch protein [Alicyclobacillus sp.]